MLNWSKLSLRRQIISLFVFIEAILLIGISFYFTYSERQFYLSQLQTVLENEARLIMAQEVINFEQETTQMVQWLGEMGKILDKRITVINRQGVVLADSDYNAEEMDNHLDRPEIKAILAGEAKGISIRKSDTINIDMYYLAVPLERRGEIAGFIRISESLREINLIIRRNIINNFFFLLVMLLITLLLVWKYSKDIINPLNKITGLAGKLARGNFQERIRVNDQNEIGTLARMLNFMAAQLESMISQISEEKSRAEAILTSMLDGLIAVDKQLYIRLINPAAQDIFAVKPGKLKGRKLIEVIRHHEIDNYLEAAMENNQILSEELSLQKGEKKILRCNFVPIVNEEGEVTGGVVVFNDITELRRLEQMRTEFVGNVSHELRTPLTSIIGYIDTIVDNQIEDLSTLKRFLKIIKTEADRLALLIKDLLDLSRLEGKERQFSLLPGDLPGIINKTVLLLRDQAERKGITIIKELPAYIPPVYMVAEQVEQVLMNLIDNSIKYTAKKGWVKICLRVEQQRVIVEIKDNGLGISPADQERIFERFYRVDKARSSSQGGTGIGLSIVKHIIQNHQSKITVESEPGKGSIFRFHLQKVEKK